jgi:hypothetical protein
MVYGSHNHRSGTGIAYSRNPQNGAKEMFGTNLPPSPSLSHGLCLASQVISSGVVKEMMLFMALMLRNLLWYGEKYSSVVTLR